MWRYTFRHTLVLPSILSTIFQPTNTVDQSSRIGQFINQSINPSINQSTKEQTSKSGSICTAIVEFDSCKHFTRIQSPILCSCLRLLNISSTVARLWMGQVPFATKFCTVLFQRPHSPRYKNEIFFISA